MLPNMDDLLTEITFKTSRSGGSGGQNVNKVATKVELNFDVQNSQFLSDFQKRRISEKLANRITTAGILQLISQVERTQLRNKKRVVERFHEVIAMAFEQRKFRKPTKTPKSVIEKRLTNKKRTSEIKKSRKTIE